MKERPILYKKEMILAKKREEKDTTRRPLRIQPRQLAREKIPDWDGNMYLKQATTLDGWYGTAYCTGSGWETGDYMGHAYPTEYGKPGDRLYIKENYTVLDYSNFEQALRIEYQADEERRWIQLSDSEWEKYHNWEKPIGFKPSIFMFRSLSRFLDEIVSIHAEWIQDITPEEALREGIKTWVELQNTGKYYNPDGKLIGWWVTAFQRLWDSIHGKGAFENNDVVWVIRTKPVLPEKEHMKAEVKEGILQ